MRPGAAMELLEKLAGSPSNSYPREAPPLVNLVKKEREAGPETGTNEWGKLEYLRLKREGLIPHDPVHTQEPEDPSEGQDITPEAAKIAGFIEELGKLAGDIQPLKNNLNADRRVGSVGGTLGHQNLYGSGPSFSQQAVTSGRGQIKTPAMVKGALS